MGDAKRGKTGGGGFSTDTDLEVVVEGEAFNVHSLILMLASPDFQNMLESAMRSIELPGKKNEEFKVFLEAIAPGAVCSRLII